MSHPPCRIGSPGIPTKKGCMLQCDVSILAHRRKYGNIRLNSEVRNLSPRVKQTASARMALEMVYPGHRPAPGPGALVSSACSPTYASRTNKSDVEETENLPTYVKLQVFDVLVQGSGSGLEYRSKRFSAIQAIENIKPHTWISGSGFHSLKEPYAACEMSYSNWSRRVQK